MQTPDVQRLLQETVSTQISSTARVASREILPIGSGMSGATLRRYRVTLENSSGESRQVELVTKEAHLRERRVLAWLNTQRQPNVPFSHTLDLTTEGSALICMQDVGDTYRPTSLEPITPEALREEAVGLAAIHAANLGHSSELAWLLRIERSYFAEYVIERCWRPHWEKALSSEGFRSTFQPCLARVEVAAAAMVEEMSALAAEGDVLTLIHTDINPSNVLVHEGKPYYIDWQVAHFGPFYLDLPHHFCTLQQAEHYRQALAALGTEIPAADFEERYRAAARCIGFRYIWWTLEGWRPGARETEWVQHYLDLTLGRP
jgi:aminoglycoside phosphotransferase (APT) family kinase protein